MRSLIFLGLVCAAVAQPPEGEASRDIWDTGFRAKRPVGAKAVQTPEAPKAISYKPVKIMAFSHPPKETSAQETSGNRIEGNQAVGVTVWQMRPAGTRDAGVPRLLMQTIPSEEPAQYVPHRIRLDQPLHVGDRVRVSIELPQEGFVYVVDRERYRDGSVGMPYLIFPVQNLNRGDNRVEPGRLIEIPSQSDPITALNVVRRDDRHVGEELLILFSPERLPSVTVPRPDTPISAELVKSWEQQWPAATRRLDLASEDNVWTFAEKAAGAEERLLTQSDPMPQSIFVAATAPRHPFLLRIPLEVR